MADRRSGFAGKVVSALKARVKASFSTPKEVSSDRLDMMLEYAISGMFAVYQTWFNSDRKMPIEGIFEDVSIMTFSGVYGLIGTE